MEEAKLHAALLIGMYSQNHFTILRAIAELDSQGMLQSLPARLPFMQGHVMYEILRLNDKQAKNPYYGTPPNKLCWQMVNEDMQTKAQKSGNLKDILKQYMRKSVIICKLISDLRATMYSTSAPDAKALVIAGLSAPLALEKSSQ